MTLGEFAKFQDQAKQRRKMLSDEILARCGTILRTSGASATCWATIRGALPPSSPGILRCHGPHAVCGVHDPPIFVGNCARPVEIEIRVGQDSVVGIAHGRCVDP